MRLLRSGLSILAAIAAAAAGACGRGAGSPSAGSAGETWGDGDRSGAHRAEARVYAAASLSDVVAALAEPFAAIRGSRLVPSYGASGTLAQQIREGAPPGVFISASAEWADRLDEWGMVEPGTRVDLLSNALVVVVPRDAAWRPAGIEALAGDALTRLALADPQHVPAGTYAKAALVAAGVFERLRGRVVAAPDVRTALAYVERGEAGAGIVYATDAASSSRVDVALRVPPELHPRIVYPMVLVKGSNRRAREFHAFLQGDVAWARFAKAVARPER